MAPKATRKRSTRTRKKTQILLDVPELECSFEDIGKNVLMKDSGGGCEGTVVPLQTCQSIGTIALRLYYRELSKHPELVDGYLCQKGPAYIIYEYQLVMARSGLFYDGVEGWNICQGHRQKLGWDWKRPDKNCYHPEHCTWTSEEGLKPYIKTHGCSVVNFDLSKKLYRDYGILLPVGTGICEFCFNKERDLARMPCDEVGPAFSHPIPLEKVAISVAKKEEKARKRAAKREAKIQAALAYPVALTKVNPGASDDNPDVPIEFPQGSVPVNPDGSMNLNACGSVPVGAAASEGDAAATPVVKPHGVKEDDSDGDDDFKVQSYEDKVDDDLVPYKRKQKMPKRTGKKVKVEPEEDNGVAPEPVTITKPVHVEPVDDEHGSNVKDFTLHVCSVCYLGFEAEEELAEHKMVKHPEDGASAKAEQSAKDAKQEQAHHVCDICSEVFDDYVALCSHHFMAHREDESSKKKRRSHSKPARPDIRPEVRLEDPGYLEPLPQKGDRSSLGRLAENQMTSLVDFKCLTVHLGVNFSGWDHTCRFCHKKFVEYEAFRVHMKKHCAGERECPMCADAFDGLREFCEHMQEHETARSTSGVFVPKFCDHCAHAYPESFIKARATLHEGPDKSDIVLFNICVFCLAVCSCTIDLPDHFQTDIYRCAAGNYCPVFDSETDFARHSFFEHTGCHICNYKMSVMSTETTAHRVNTYDSHIRVVHKCPKCGDIFKTQAEKTRHFLNEHNKTRKICRPKIRMCYHCGTNFNNIIEKCKHTEGDCPNFQRDTTKKEVVEKLNMSAAANHIDDNAHMRTMTGISRGGKLMGKILQKKFVCLFCMELLKSKLDFNVHKVTCKPILKCTSCERNLRETEGYAFHLEHCPTCRKLECLMCRKFTGTPEKAFEHARECKEKANFMVSCCMACKKKISGYEGARMHRCIPDGLPTGIDKVLPVDYHRKKVQAQAGISKEDFNVNEGEGVRAIYTCKHCGINLPRKCSSHEMYCTQNIHRSRKSYCCDYCGIGFYTRVERDVHLITCMKGKCDFCSENFGNEGHRIMHMRGCKYKPKVV